ncbi:hypothetical protein GCM10027610_076040 [Dactylosporangium cerinum]
MVRPGNQRDRGRDGADAGLVEQCWAHGCDQVADLAKVRGQQTIDIADLCGQSRQLVTTEAFECVGVIVGGEAGGVADLLVGISAAELVA